MTTDEGRELLCNIQGTTAARLIAISQARFAAGGSTNIIINFSAILSPDLSFSRQILQRTCLVRLLGPNLCSYKRLAIGAVKIISAKRILAFDWSMDVISPTLQLTRLF
jgi:hypothetical protein